MKTFTLSLAEDYTVAVHRGGAAGAPVFAYVNAHANSAVGAYVYTIGKGADTYSSVLQQGEPGLRDMAASLGHVLLVRLRVPAYVSVSGHVSPEDWPQVAQGVVGHVNEESHVT